MIRDMVIIVRGQVASSNMNLTHKGSKGPFSSVIYIYIDETFNTPSVKNLSVINLSIEHIFQHYKLSSRCHRAHNFHNNSTSFISNSRYIQQGVILTPWIQQQTVLTILKSFLAFPLSFFTWSWSSLSLVALHTERLCNICKKTDKQQL